MSGIAQQVRAETPGHVTSSDTRPSIVDSGTLLLGQRELLIRHGDQTYRLRLTASDKLILTK